MPSPRGSQCRSIPRRLAWLSAPLLALTVAGVATAMPAGAGVPGPFRSAGGRAGASVDGRLTVLDVPYIAQEPRLCGGAAAAMVLRYWGRPGVRDTDFAALVDPATDGIRATELVADLRARGAQVLLPEADLEMLAAEIERGRPPIVLLRVGESAYHYVVVVARGAGAVLYHDPAVGPYRLLSQEAFDRRWRAAGRWAAIVVVPRPAAAAAAEPPATTDAVDAGACTPIVRDGIQRSRAGDVAAARQRLEAAVDLCPESSTAWRELAGVHFLQKDWTGAARFAAIAAERDPGDRHAWRILATSRYLAGDPEGALEAWNAVGEPRADLLTVPDLAGIRQPVLERRIGIAPGSLLTPGELAVARRRLAALPAAGRTRLSYAPSSSGSAEITAAIVPRTGLDQALPLLVRTGLDALVASRLRVRIASPTGGGELLEGTWRWQANRPGLAVSLTTPEPAGIPGVLRVEGEWQVQTYGPADGATLRETLRRGAAGLERWVDANTWLRGGIALERWSSRGLDVVLSSAAERRLLADHVAVRAEGGLALAAGQGAGYGRWHLSARARTTARSHAAGIFATAGLAGVSGDAPVGAWPGAGTGRAREALLRAHPLLADGVIVGEAFGRRLLHGGMEGRIYPVRVGPVPVGAAAFVDLGRVDDALTGASPGRLLVDAGVGLRLGIPGAPGDLRIDGAVDLRRGGFVLSAGWQRDWE